MNSVIRLITSVVFFLFSDFRFLQHCTLFLLLQLNSLILLLTTKSLGSISGIIK